MSDAALDNTLPEPELWHPITSFPARWIDSRVPVFVWRNDWPFPIPAYLKDGGWHEALGEENSFANEPPTHWRIILNPDDLARRRRTEERLHDARRLALENRNKSLHETTLSFLETVHFVAQHKNELEEKNRLLKLENEKLKLEQAMPIDRLMAERSQLYSNMASTIERCSELLEKNRELNRDNLAQAEEINILKDEIERLKREKEAHEYASKNSDG